MTERLWDLMQADHDSIWDLLDGITGGSDRPPDDTTRQGKVARHLVRLQSAHEFAEERVVVPLVRRHVEDGAELLAEVLEQERQLKRVLNELYHLSPGTTEFEECVNTLAAENRNHLTFEQNQVWPRLDDALSDEQLRQAAGRWARNREAAPTRPHPHVPPHAWLLSSAGMLLAARDRAADRLRGRRVPPPQNRAPGPLAR